MKKIFITAFVFLLTSLSFAWAEVEMKGSPEELRRILHPQVQMVTLQASAEKTAYTDKAIVELMVTTEEKRLSDSLNKNAQLRETLTQELIKQGIDSNNIKSAKFASSPEYGFWGDKPSSYTVNNRVSVSVMDSKHIQDIATIADQYEEVELVGTSFEHTEKEVYEQAVKEEVMKKIMDEKASYEKMLGLTLKPIGINNIQVYSSGSQSSMQFQQRKANTEMLADSSAKVYASATSPVQNAPASFDELKYFANIYVNFEVVNPSASSSN